jgi:hypothetical protein
MIFMAGDLQGLPAFYNWFVFEFWRFQMVAERISPLHVRCIDHRRTG